MFSSPRLASWPRVLLAFFLVSVALVATAQPSYDTLQSPYSGTWSRDLGHALDMEGEFLAVGDPGADSDTTGNGMVVVYRRDRDGAWAPFQELFSQATDRFGNFGYAVAISGTTLVVGDPSADAGNGRYSGIVHVYQFDGRSWELDVTLSTEVSQERIEFGSALDLEGDYLAVGAPLRGLGDHFGAVFVFERSEGLWTQRAELTLDIPFSQYFGATLDLSEDSLIASVRGMNGNGGGANIEVADIFVRDAGTWRHQDSLTRPVPTGLVYPSPIVAISGDMAMVGLAHGASNNGSVSAFLRQGQDWVFQDNIPAPGETNSYGKFGGTMDVEGDRLVVSANSEKLGTFNGGAAHIYDRQGDDWVLTQTIFGTTELSQRSGWTLAIDGTVLAAGAPDFYVYPRRSAGAICLFEEGQTGWSQISFFDTRLAATSTRFGFSLARDGDTAIVGVPGANDLSEGGGAAIVYTRVGDEWMNQGSLVASNSFEGDALGYSVSISGDTAAVGAPGQYLPLIVAYSGSVYLFERSGGKWTRTHELTAPMPFLDDFFGGAVALQGDTLAVGCKRDDDAAQDAGAVHFFRKESSNWVYDGIIVDPAASFGSGFGHALAIDETGTRLVIGALGRDEFQGEFASAYIFDLVDDRWTQSAQLIAADLGEHHDFGCSVDIDGDTVIVGAQQVGFGRTGGAFIFEQRGTGWTQSASLYPRGAGAWSQFGGKVAIDGDIALISSAEAANSFHPIQGSVRVFTRHQGVWSERAALEDITREESEGIGASLVLDGTEVLIGTTRASAQAYRSGAAYSLDLQHLFDASGSQVIVR